MYSSRASKNGGCLKRVKECKDLQCATGQKQTVRVISIVKASARVLILEEYDSDSRSRSSSSGSFGSSSSGGSSSRSSLLPSQSQPQSE